MDAKRLRKYQKRLHSRIPLVAGWLKQRAAQALVQAHSPAAVRVVAEAITRSDDARVQEIMLEGLRQLTDRSCIDAVCAVWAATRHVRLAALLTERGWVASVPAGLEVLSALLVGQPEVVTARGTEVVVAQLIRACEDTDSTIATRARQALHDLKNTKAQETLCRMVLERDHPVAREVAIAAQYAPQDPQQRALFYFLTEQWDRYENLDFDQTLLPAIYASGDTGLQKRVAEMARRAGRVEWVEVVTGGRLKRRLGEMKDGEWEATLALLSTQKQGETMWRLAQVAPAVWSVRLLHQLADMAWMPQAEQERAGFVEMRRLAVMLAGKTPELQLHRFVHSVSTLGELTHGSLYPRRSPFNPGCCLAMSPDGRVLASGSSDETVRLWSVPDGKALRTLTGHTGKGWVAGWVRCLAMSPDGQVLASGSSDETVRLWGPEPLRLSYLPLGHTNVEDMVLVQQTLQSGDLSKTDRGWLEFLLAMMRWPRRFDIGGGEAPQRMEVGEFDIEIEG